VDECKPLVRGKRLSRIGILRFQKHLNLKVDSNYLHYQDVLQALTSRAMGIDIDALPMEVQAALEAGPYTRPLFSST